MHLICMMKVFTTCVHPNRGRTPNEEDEHLSDPTYGWEGFDCGNIWGENIARGIWKGPFWIWPWEKKERRTARERKEKRKRRQDKQMELGAKDQEENQEKREGKRTKRECRQNDWGDIWKRNWRKGRETQLREALWSQNSVTNTL